MRGSVVITENISGYHLHGYVSQRGRIIYIYCHCTLRSFLRLARKIMVLYMTALLQVLSYFFVYAVVAMTQRVALCFTSW